MKPLLFSLLMLTAPALPAVAQDWALDGYDAVGFVEMGRAIPGRSDIATLWKGQLWHFASEENRARFESDPRAYTPGFGGLCPVSLAQGHRVEGDPLHFVVVGHRLYLLRSDSDERQFLDAPRQVLAKAREFWASLR